MATQNDLEEILNAWRALREINNSTGWNTIHIGNVGNCMIRAGRYFPENTEALLVGFLSVQIPQDAYLPQGQGFSVSAVNVPSVVSSHHWIALSRQDNGSCDLFTTMAVDLIGMLKGFVGNDENQRLHAFLARIRAWQDFMRIGMKEVLGSEAETGLFGELVFLQALLKKIPVKIAVGAWQGPLGGVQDFTLGTGAVEVKTTVQSHDFPVSIGTLDQLDDTHIHPLFIAAVRLSPDASGLTLPEQASFLRSYLFCEPAFLAMFDARLFYAGLFEASAGQYFRRFLLSEFRIFRISDQFPRLIRANVPVGIENAGYQIDLDRIQLPEIKLDHALQQLGAS